MEKKLGNEIWKQPVIESYKAIDLLKKDSFLLGPDIQFWIETLSSNNIQFWKDQMIEDYSYDVLNYQNKDKNENVSRSIKSIEKNIEYVFKYSEENIYFFNDLKTCFLAGILATVFDKNKKISWFNVSLSSDFNKKEINLINTLYYFTFAFPNHVFSDLKINLTNEQDNILLSTDAINRDSIYKRLSCFIKTIEIDLESIGLF